MKIEVDHLRLISIWVPESFRSNVLGWRPAAWIASKISFLCHFCRNGGGAAVFGFLGDLAFTFHHLAEGKGRGEFFQGPLILSTPKSSRAINNARLRQLH